MQRFSLIKYILVVIYCLLPWAVLPISSAIEKIGIDQGLSNNFVLSITEDRDGFLWFATEWGLNRFDGKTFTVYKNLPEDSNSPADNGYNKILYSKKYDIIWIATKRHGLNTLNCANRQFKRYPEYDDNPNSTKAYGITDMCFDEQENLWLATFGNGLKKLSVQEDSVIHYDEEVSQNGYIWCVADDHAGHLYLGHDKDGLGVLSLKDGTIKHFLHHPGDMSSLPSNTVLTILVDSHKRVWLGTHNGLALYIPQQENFITFKHDSNRAASLMNNHIQSLMEKDGSLWVGTSRGISILDLSQDLTQTTEKINFNQLYTGDLPAELSNGVIRDIFQDTFGNVWVATNRGINFISYIEPFFNNIRYSTLKTDVNSLTEKDAVALCYDDKHTQLWVSTDGGGLDVYEKARKVAHYSADSQNFPGNNIVACMVDSRGDIWFGTSTNGLIRLNRKTNRFEKIQVPGQDLYISYLFEDRDKNIWIANNEGIYKYSSTNGQIAFFPGSSISLPNNLIRSVAQDSDGNLWFGSLINGLAITTPDLRLIKHIAGPINNINHMYCDSSNNMWVATINGLFKFPLDEPSYAYRKLSKAEGLSDDFVHAIVEGSKGEIWMSTSKGISCYIEQNDHFINYDNFLGVPRGGFLNRSVANAQDGTIFFGSQYGVCYFNAHQDISPYQVPPVLIADFSIYDAKQQQLNHSVKISKTSPIKLKYNQNTFTITFNVMDYALKNLVEFSYSLKGLDDLWYQTGESNKVTFRNLSPGKYKFFVKSRIRTQNWNEQAASLQIEIVPPFWMTWWAKLFYWLVSFSIVFLLIRYYIDKKNHKIEQELNNEKLLFYTNIAHELKTPLSLIISPLSDLLKNENMKQEHTKVSLIHKNAVRLSELINQIMEFRKSETNNRKLCVQYDDLFLLIEDITLKYKELNQNKDLTIDVFVETTNRFLYYDREVITIVIDNLISNAIKYTPKGSIGIYIRDIEKKGVHYTEIEVRDTGTGILENMFDKIFDRYFQVKNEGNVSGSGIGLALVKNLMQLHEGNIEVSSKIKEGTSFYVQLKTAHTYPGAVHLEVLDKTPLENKQEQGLPVLLLVEDHPDMRKYIVGSLNDSFEIIEAENGQQGVELALERIPDIIISDIMMPIMDGVALCKILKEDIRTSHIPILLLTAKDSVRDKMTGYATGADAYVTKPFEVDLLKIRINTLLDVRKKIIDYFSSNTYKRIIATDALSTLDNQFVEKVITLIEDNIESDQVNASFLANELCMSQSSFSRKVKALTGLTTVELVRKIKMQHAEQLLLERKHNITDVAYQLGFTSMSHFRKHFKTEFGTIPSEYIKNFNKEKSE